MNQIMDICSSWKAGSVKPTMLCSASLVEQVEQRAADILDCFARALRHAFGADAERFREAGGEFLRHAFVQRELRIVQIAVQREVEFDLVLPVFQRGDRGAGWD